MPNIVYTVAEKVEMVQRRLQGLSYQRVADHFAATYPNRPIPSIMTVKRIVDKFKRTGNVNPEIVKIVQPSKQLSVETKLDICLTAVEGERKSMSTIAKELGVSRTSVSRVLQQEKYQLPAPNRQPSLPKETKNRTIFRRNISFKSNLNETLIDRIWCTDECTVMLAVTPDKQNVKIWSGTDPHSVIASGAQYQNTFFVWIGMLADRLLGPYFIDGNLNGDKYLQMLRDQIVPALRNLEGNGPRIWFQQNGTPPHFTASVRQYLNEQFPGCWIGSGGPVEWPTNSMDITPFDCSLCSYLKNWLQEEGRINNVNQLKSRITEVLKGMDPRDILRMNRAVHYRRELYEAENFDETPSKKRRDRNYSKPRRNSDPESVSGKESTPDVEPVIYFKVES